jgi:hypothetical protein
VVDHGHVVCINLACPKADVQGFAAPGEPRPQRG